MDTEYRDGGDDVSGHWEWYVADENGHAAASDRIAELEAALLAFHDSPPGDVNELSMRLEQVEAELARLTAHFTDLWANLSSDDRASWTATWAEGDAN